MLVVTSAPTVRVLSHGPTGRLSTVSTVDRGSRMGFRDAGVNTIVAGNAGCSDRRSDTDILQQSIQDNLMAEIVSRHRSSGLAVSAVIRPYLFDGFQDFVYRGKREQPSSGRQDTLESGVLSDHGPAGREIGCASIAEPTRAQPDVLVF